MAKKTKSELKDYFQAGKRPTESQFEDFIDSYAHLDDTRIRELNNSEYTVNLQFPANYQVGDYVEFVGFHPEMASSSGFYEISVAYTRGSIASAATHIASVSHSNPNIWRECGRINTNNYVGYANGDCFTIDAHGSLNRFRIRATRVLGDPASNMSVAIKVRSINKNLSWDEMDNRGNDTSNIPLQPMTDQWELLVGSAFSADSAKVALKVIQNGNVGVGTKLPYSKLHVVSPFSTAQEPGTFIIGDVNYPNLRMGHNEQYTWIQSHSGAPLHINPLGNNVIFNKDAGNVGIGTSSPTSKLDVNGVIKSGVHSNEGGAIFLENNSKNTPNTANRWAIYNMTGGYGDGLQFWSYSADGAYGVKLKLSDTGNMALYGKLEAKDVIITPTPTADFVFDSGYNLKPIHALEQFISENQHLPEIPSAKEMTENGLAVGDFQIKLLQKIEELTLYVISLKKEVDTLRLN